MASKGKKNTEATESEAIEGEDAEEEEDLESDEDDSLILSPDADKDDDYVPEGFAVLGAEQAPFLIKAPGVVVVGELLGLHERKKQASNMRGSNFFYQIRLEQPVMGVVGSKKKNTQKRVRVGPNEPAGDVISIDEFEALKDLQQLIVENHRYRVWIRFLRKDNLDNGNTFWVVKKRYEPISVPGAGLNGNQATRRPEARR
jgi:hypothetical protein